MRLSAPHHRYNNFIVKSSPTPIPIPIPIPIVSMASKQDKQGSPVKNVAVIGAGVSGLSAAYKLKLHGLNVTVFEADGIVGGKLRSISRDGLIWDEGANTMTESEAPVGFLLDNLGLRDKQQFPLSQQKRYIAKNGVPVLLPSNPVALVRSNFLSAGAKLQIFLEPFLWKNNNASKGPNAEESVGDFFQRHFGKEAVDYLIDPFVAGTSGGDPGSLSMQHVFPEIWNLEKRFGSIISGAIQSKFSAKKDTSGEMDSSAKKKQKNSSFSFLGGMQTLTNALCDELSKDEIKLKSKVLELACSCSEKSPQDNWSISYELNDKKLSSEKIFDALIVTVSEVQCEQPNNSLYTFTGNLIIDKQTLPLSPNQLLLRGCSLRNTECIVGAVIFTGHETKVMMNSMKIPSKRSTLEKKLDKLILALFTVLFCMCLLGSIGSGIFINRKYYYLRFDSSEAQFNPDGRFVVAILTFFTLITLYSPIIPISLYVSVEMIKFIQSTQFINNDLRMYHAESNTPALARTSNLNEELGQVEYIFSDKTGTLTRNLMEFFKCSIAGEVYGTGVSEIELGTAQRTGVKVDTQKQSNAIREKGFNFDDARLMRGAWRNEPNPECCKEFFRCLAICHTVLPEGDESPERIRYQAASPDEAALVTAAKNFGFFFYRRTPTMIYVRESHVEKMGKVQDFSYEILNVLEFNSTRKRQSVVCRYPDGRLVLYCKGADTVIYERLADGHTDLKRITREHLEQFGATGLRTLCLAYKHLSPDVYESWNEKFIQAKSALRDREKKLDEVSELIEKELILIGCTAIEDKLQEGVPGCIETLSRAGIKIWVLTGDKMETAINIAYACRLINNGMKQFVISSETEEIREVEDKGDQVELARFMKDMVKNELKSCYEEAQQHLQSPSGPKLALIIDGKCLMYALDPSLRVMLLNLSLNCSAVVCCRVSPLQKAQVTSLVKKGANRITLSIGDGANDVSMIQAAHVGVGISGQEGMQAVMASDFAIAQFRFLTDLLLVHGRWSYHRICKVVTYFFYKNLTFTLTQFWFTFQTGFSGQRFYDDWFQSLYNVIFTALPVIIIGLFDKDVSAALSKKYPELYKEGIRNAFFKWRVVATWAFFSIYQSLILYYFVVASSNRAINSAGKMVGLWDVSTMAFTCVVVTVNLRLLMMCNTVTRWHHISVGGSILAWFVFVFIYSGIVLPNKEQENIYFVIYVLMSTFYFYLTLLLVPIAALFCDFVYMGAQRWFFPYDYQIVQEIHRHEADTSRIGLLEVGNNQLSADEARSYAIMQLPGQKSRHTGFAFDSPGYESFFASQAGVYVPQKAWDVARRASMRNKPKTPRTPRTPRTPQKN